MKDENLNFGFDSIINKRTCKVLKKYPKLIFNCQFFTALSLYGTIKFASSVQVNIKTTICIFCKSQFWNGSYTTGHACKATMIINGATKWFYSLQGSVITNATCLWISAASKGYKLFFQFR